MNNVNGLKGGKIPQVKKTLLKGKSRLFLRLVYSLSEDTACAQAFRNPERALCPAGDAMMWEECCGRGYWEEGNSWLRR